MRAFLASLVVLSSFSLLLAACGGPDPLAAGASGDVNESDDALTAENRAVVFTLSNEDQNAVLSYRRSASGTLTPAGSTFTGGHGAGKGLGSQGALAFSPDHHWLFAVNAGSNQLSSFEVYGTALVLQDVVDSGGQRPVSVTAYGNLVYVVNADGGGNIAGFTVSGAGRLTPIPDSKQPLSAADAAPAQVQFTPDGTRLVVTEKATNHISTYRVRRNGAAVGPTVSQSSGTTPFGFTFTRDGLLVVSEAFGGAPGASATSSYWIDSNGVAQPVSRSVPNGQGAACWAVATRDGAYAFIANFGSSSISTYDIDTAGQLHVHGDGRAAVTGDTSSKPADLALSAGNQFLYALDPGTHAVKAFRVNADGSLTEIAGATGLPAAPAGLLAR